MSRKNKQYREKNPFLMVLYIIVAAALIACLAWVVMSNRKRDAEYAETLARLAMDETEYVRETHRETETESETASKARETSREAESNVEEDTETEGSEETEHQTSNVKDTAILVLNGTERSGVAAYWSSQLEEAGYTDVTPASYQRSSGQQTTVYTDNELCAEELKEIFPDASYQSGTPEGNYTLEDSVTAPEDVEVYIVIGTDDTDYEEAT